MGKEARKKKTNSQRTRAHTPTCSLGPSMTYRAMWINRSYKTRLLGDYSIKRQNSWGRCKQRTELGTKAQQNLIWPLSSLEGPSLGEKAKCGGIDVFALPSLPSSQSLPSQCLPFSLPLFHTPFPPHPPVFRSSPSLPNSLLLSHKIGSIWICFWYILCVCVCVVFGRVFFFFFFFY